MASADLALPGGGLSPPPGTGPGEKSHGYGSREGTARPCPSLLGQLLPGTSSTLPLSAKPTGVVKTVVGRGQPPRGTVPRKTVSRWNKRGLRGAGTGGTSLALRAPFRVMRNPCLLEAVADPKIGCGLASRGLKPGATEPPIQGGPRPNFRETPPLRERSRIFSQ